MRIRIRGFDDKIVIFYNWNTPVFFISKIVIYLSWHKGGPSYRRSLQPLEENFKQFKTWNSSLFLVLFPYWILKTTTINADTDPQHWKSKSKSLRGISNTHTKKSTKMKKFLRWKEQNALFKGPKPVHGYRGQKVFICWYWILALKNINTTFFVSPAQGMMNHNKQK